MGMVPPLSKLEPAQQRKAVRSQLVRKEVRRQLVRKEVRTQNARVLQMKRLIVVVETWAAGFRFRSMGWRIDNQKP